MDGIPPSYVYWDANDYILDLPRMQESQELKMDQVEFSLLSSRPSKGVIDIAEYKNLIDTKNKIQYCKNWEKWSSLVHPYEKVVTLSRNEQYKRYYYMFMEMFTFYNKHPTTVRVFDDPTDECSLFEKSSLDEKVECIVSNSTVDYQVDPHNKEQLYMYTFVKQFIRIFKELEDGGTCIVRLYDMVTRPTCQFLYFLTSMFNVHIYKPRVSKITNSERYVVCTDFKPNEELIRRITDWFTRWKEEEYCKTFDIDVPEDVEKLIKQYNHKLITLQVIYIDIAIGWSNNEEQISENQLEAHRNNKANEFHRLFTPKSGENLNSNHVVSCKHMKRTKAGFLTRMKHAQVCERCLSLLV